MNSIEFHALPTNLQYIPIFSILKCIHKGVIYLHRQRSKNRHFCSQDVDKTCVFGTKYGVLASTFGAATTTTNQHYD